jgi:hypothetical protein
VHDYQLRSIITSKKKVVVPSFIAFKFFWFKKVKIALHNPLKKTVGALLLVRENYKLQIQTLTRQTRSQQQNKNSWLKETRGTARRLGWEGLSSDPHDYRDLQSNHGLVKAGQQQKGRSQGCTAEDTNRQTDEPDQS